MNRIRNTQSCRALPTGGIYGFDPSADGDGDGFGSNCDCDDPQWPALPAGDVDADGGGVPVCQIGRHTARGKKLRVGECPVFATPCHASQT